MNAPTDKTPINLRVIMAGEQAFTAGLRSARAVGGPAKDIDALCALRKSPPAVGYMGHMSRMTLGIQRLMQKRAAMPDPMDSLEIAAFFVRGPELFGLLESYDLEGQAWKEEATRERWEAIMLAVQDAMGSGSESDLAEISAWLKQELDTYYRLSHGDDDDTARGAPQMSGGASGSRVGWWLRAVEGICAQFGAAAPRGVNLTHWAVWEFPINDYLALLPAALERAGVELPEHYAVKEARKARREAKAKAAAETEADTAGATPSNPTA